MRSPAGRVLAPWALLAGSAALVGGCTVQVPLPSAAIEVDGGDPPASRPDAAAPSGPPASRPPAPDAAGGEAGSDDGSTCWDTPVPREMVPVQGIIAFDRSSTMVDTRVESVRAKLAPALTALSGAVEFGYIEFPEPTCDPASGCCAASDILVPPTLGSATVTAINKLLACNGNGRTCGKIGPQRTPTDDALQRIDSYFHKNSSMDADRFVVLVTDGAPNCGGIDGPCTRARHWAEDLWFSRLSVKTAILALGQDANFITCLSSIALDGGNPFKPASSAGLPFVWIKDVTIPTAVADAVNEVLGPLKARTCAVRLAGPRNSPADVDVRINGVALKYDVTHTDGWDFEGGHNRAIHIYGPKCTQVQTGMVQPRNVQATVICRACGDNIDCH
jgi:hypothetical protein